MPRSGEQKFCLATHANEFCELGLPVTKMFTLPPAPLQITTSILTMSQTNPTTGKSSENKPHKTSPSAQILSNVELLVAMCEEQERAAAAASEPADTSVIETAVEKSVKAAVNDTVARVVEATVSDALSSSMEKALEDCFSRFDKRIAQVEDRINQVDGQLNKLDANAQVFNARFDSLDEKIGSTTTQNDLGSAAMESQLKPQLDMIGADLAGVVSKFENQFASLERTFQDQCKTVNGFYAKLSAAESANAQPTASPAGNQADASNADDPASNWQQQKQAMLAQYGGDAKNKPDADAAIETPTTDAGNGPSEYTPESDASEVERLKQDLNAKLRQAEVELSINRARLSQERAEFERNQSELDQRSAALEAKFASMKKSEDTSQVDDDDQGGDLMTRFKRHLGS